jgi:hypothetical protein
MHKKETKKIYISKKEIIFEKISIFSSLFSFLLCLCVDEIKTKIIRGLGDEDDDDDDDAKF